MKLYVINHKSRLLSFGYQRSEIWIDIHGFSLIQEDNFLNNSRIKI